MNAPAIAEDFGTEFFAPASFDVVDGLIAQYRLTADRINEVAAFIDSDDYRVAAHYFIEGNASDQRYGVSRTVEQLFNPSGAVAALNSAYWSKALALTDVLDVMPQKRRDEWNKSIAERTAPEFTEETVRSTLAGLLAMRAQFLAERVDGIFRGLSGEHVTNRPEGFGKRMIMGYMLSYGSISHTKAGLINDLRAVVAKFMGRDEPKYFATSRLMSELYRNTGQWHTVDGGAIRIRVYKKGTAHLEVHPDIAWRLNQVLAYLYPMAIPAPFRTKPKKPTKEFALMDRPLPFAVLEILASTAYGHRAGLVYKLDSESPRHAVAYAEAARILETIGGVPTAPRTWTFDYVPDAVINEIILSGCIPDQKSYQFYPTQERLARLAVGLAEIEDDSDCLEPSAGMGGLADFMPKDRTTCVEVSGLHCKLLESKGFRVVWNDFLPWAEGRASEGRRFDRVVMNPPFSEGRWQAHVAAAAALVKPGGRLVSILPSGAASRLDMPGWSMAWHGPFSDEFAGTSIAVVVLVAVRA